MREKLIAKFKNKSILFKKINFNKKTIKLILIILGSIFIISFITIYVTKYFNYYQQKLEITQKQYQGTNSLIQKQQEALKKSQKEIEELKKDNDLNKEQQQIIQDKINSEKKSDTLNVSSEYIAERMAMLHCIQINNSLLGTRLLYDNPVSSPAIEGSGIFISSQGEILTNAHVVGVAPLCLVQVAKAPNYSVPSPSYYAKVVNKDEIFDIAKLEIISDLKDDIVTKDFNYFKISNNTPSISEKTYIAGFSVASNNRLAITEGIISGYDDLSGNIQGVYLITSAKIDSGNSGGASLTSQGELIGLPTYIMGNFESLGYILDLNRVEPYLSFQF